MLFRSYKSSFIGIKPQSKQPVISVATNPENKPWVYYRWRQSGSIDMRNRAQLEF